MLKNLTFSSVPMEESLSSEHGGELFRNSFEEFLNGSRVSNESGRHFESSWWDITYGGLDVIWDPLNEIRTILILDVEHLFVNFLHRHTSSEHGCYGKVTEKVVLKSASFFSKIFHLFRKNLDLLFCFRKILGNFDF